MNIRRILTAAGDGARRDRTRSTASHHPPRPRTATASATAASSATTTTGNAGSVSDFTGSIGDYGTTQPSCYDFKGAGAGKGKCIKNAAASVWNRSSQTVRVYFNSGHTGTYQDFAPAPKPT